MSWFADCLSWILFCGETDDDAAGIHRSNRRNDQRSPLISAPARSWSSSADRASLGKGSTGKTLQTPIFSASSPVPPPSKPFTPPPPFPSASNASPLPARNLGSPTRASSSPVPPSSKPYIPPSPPPSVSKASPLPARNLVCPTNPFAPLPPPSVSKTSPLPARNLGSPTRASSSPVPPSRKASLSLLPLTNNTSASASKACPIPDVSVPKKSPEKPVSKQKRVLPRYEIPKHLLELIKRDKVPEVVIRPLSPATYADYFAALLYAEDYYIEKWTNFILSEATLELRSRAPFENNSKGTKKEMKNNPVKKKDFVAFKMESIPDRRPYLLSRDFVFVRPSGEKREPFKGILYRVVKSIVLVEFGDDFHTQHAPSKKYDVSFSFNRVCLKRAHHAVSAATVPAVCNVLFPNGTSISHSSNTPTFLVPQSQLNVSSQILKLKGGWQPYLIEGPITTSEKLSVTGTTVREAVIQVCRTSHHRVLICSPRNITCDAIYTSLHKVIPEAQIFRANAAFRYYESFADDIVVPFSEVYEEEFLALPPLPELKKFRLIASTFMSSFRLHDAGIDAGHFSHIFLLDASSAIEPEVLVVLSHFVSDDTVVVVTGSAKDFPRFVRSEIARNNGLKISFFHRLLGMEPYVNRDPRFVACLEKSN